jgi:putative transposase
MVRAGRSVQIVDPQAGQADGRGRTRGAAEHEHPRVHWLQIHSTSPLEPLNAGITRRTDGIFLHDSAITRRVGTMLMEQNDEWSLTCRLMKLEGLQSCSNTAPTRLSEIQR